MTHRNSDRSPWSFRRKFVVNVTKFCLAVIAYVIVFQVGTPAANTAVLAAFGTVTTILTGYVVAATYEDSKDKDRENNDAPDVS